MAGERGWGGGVGDALVGHIFGWSRPGTWRSGLLSPGRGSTASSIAVEREEDTWVSLTSTPLTGWEILKGKVLGAVWAQRGFAFVPLGLWALGLATGAVHPLGLLGAVVAFAVVSWMVAALGNSRLAPGDRHVEGVDVDDLHACLSLWIPRPPLRTHQDA